MITKNINDGQIISIGEFKQLTASEEVKEFNQVGVTGFYGGYDIYHITLTDGREHQVFVG